MEPERLADIKRLLGDASIVRDDLLNVASAVEDGKMDDGEALYFLRKIVDKCDYISNEIESKFK